MNVDGAFILEETRRKTSMLLFVDSRIINDSDEFGKMFAARIALANAFKKIIQMLLSNWLVFFPSRSRLWTLALRACAAMFK